MIHISSQLCRYLTTESSSIRTYSNSLLWCVSYRCVSKQVHQHIVWKSDRRLPAVSCLENVSNVRTIRHFPPDTTLPWSRAWAQRCERPPDRSSSFPVSVSPPDATAKPVARFHHFTLPRQVSGRLAPLVWSFVVFFLPRWSESSAYIVCCLVWSEISKR